MKDREIPGVNHIGYEVNRNGSRVDLYRLDPSSGLTHQEAQNHLADTPGPDTKFINKPNLGVGGRSDVSIPQNPIEN